MNCKTRASPNSLSILEELDKLIMELKHIAISSRQQGKPGSVDLNRAMERAKLVRTLFLCRSDKKSEWTKKVAQVVAFLIDVVVKLRQ